MSGRIFAGISGTCTLNMPEESTLQFLPSAHVQCQQLVTECSWTSTPTPLHLRLLRNRILQKNIGQHCSEVLFQFGNEQLLQPKLSYTISIENKINLLADVLRKFHFRTWYTRDKNHQLKQAVKQYCTTLIHRWRWRQETDLVYQRTFLWIMAMRAWRPRTHHTSSTEH